MRHHVRFVLLLLSLPAFCALVIDSDKDDTNTRAPAEIPVWANVGLRASMTAVYLGNGWVITARHVGAGDVVLGGVSHHALPESTVQLGERKGAPPPDLIAFRIEPRPKLASLRIRSTPPGVGDPVVLIGFGRNRGARASWNGHAGWSWGPSSVLRWGTNRVSEVGTDVSMGGIVTRAFTMGFEPRGTRYEAQAAVGDSGGAAFIPRQGRLELAGVLIAVGGFPGQPPDTSLYGNVTSAADLSVYKRELAALLREH
jgi:hypothetical protein